jgi:DNA helicase II / ATP-dependent DNA helicase PcrA
MAQITCGNCGGAHNSVAEVRQCHAAGPQNLFDVAEAAHPYPQPYHESSAPVPGLDRVRLDAPADAWAGPEALGRWFVILPDGNVPAAWAEAERFVIDASVLADPSERLEQLLPRWINRQRTVVQLDVPFFDRPTEIERAMPWDIDPSFTFALEQLWFIVWANSVDGTDGAPRWAWAEAGAKRGGGPDGDPHWYDGGPISLPTEGLSTIHRVSIERRVITPLSHTPCTADLAPDQLAAVMHDGAAARIIAPAGSGKTRVLTERARHLLKDWHLPADAVTLVAFNVRAAQEIRERTEDLADLQIRTLNALALAIVNGSGRFRNRGARLGTVDEREVRRILDTLVTFPRKANTDPAQAWIDALAQVRLGLRTPASVEAMFDGDVPGFAEIFPKFRAVLAERKSLDFDEQITAAIIALLTEPDTRIQAQEVARVLLVDEFQDLAPAHLLLLRLLSSPELAVFGVGDDDQTIYGYAGASPEWLISFDRLFPGAGDHPLEVNYRCPPAVVEAAATLLTHNRRRVSKTIRPRPDRTVDADALRIVADDDQVSSSVATVRRLIDAGALPSDMAVLTRVTASLAPVQVALRHAGVPTQAAIDARYLERTGVRTALAWLHIASNTDRLFASDIDATARRPSRGISPRVVSWMTECKDQASLVKLAGRITSERDSDKVSAYAHDISQVAAKAIKGATTMELLAFVRDRVGLDDALSKLDRSRADAQSTHLDDLDALTALARLHPDHTTFADWLREELSAPGNPNGVTLSSIHRVKGREWPHIIIYDVRDGVTPHRLADDQQEERRVFHVALTRCSQSVTVLSDAACSSRFLDEMDHEAGPEPERIVRSRSSVTAPAAAGSFKGDDTLRDRLRVWRSDRAKADSVPAYVVFTNVTLDALADIAPTSLDELKRIPGIGPAKRERYGDAIVELIGAHIGG